MVCPEHKGIFHETTRRFPKSVAIRWVRKRYGEEEEAFALSLAQITEKYELGAAARGFGNEKEGTRRQRLRHVRRGRRASERPLSAQCAI